MREDCVDYHNGNNGRCISNACRRVCDSNDEYEDANGTCYPKKPNDAVCDSNYQCRSGTCGNVKNEGKKCCGNGEWQGYCRGTQTDGQACNLREDCVNFHNGNNAGCYSHVCRSPRDCDGYWGACQGACDHRYRVYKRTVSGAFGGNDSCPRDGEKDYNYCQNGCPSGKSCVGPQNNKKCLQVSNEDQHCWHDCQQTGNCNWCGEDGACCRRGFIEDSGRSVRSCNNGNHYSGSYHLDEQNHKCYADYNKLNL